MCHGTFGSGRERLPERDGLFENAAELVVWTGDTQESMKKPADPT
jgi:hypothetical protein